jgi:hypothetical protein
MSDFVYTRPDVRTALQIPLLRTKRSHRKSRSGCVKCKQRRVKVRCTRRKTGIPLILQGSATRRDPNVELAAVGAWSVSTTGRSRWHHLRMLRASIHCLGNHKHHHATYKIVLALEVVRRHNNCTGTTAPHHLQHPPSMPISRASSPKRISNASLQASPENVHLPNRTGSGKYSCQHKRSCLPRFGTACLRRLPSGSTCTGKKKERSLIPNISKWRHPTATRSSSKAELSSIRSNRSTSIPTSQRLVFSAY